MTRPDNLTFFDIFEKNARLFPQAPALRFQGETHSFETLFTCTQKLAAGLNSLTLSPNARVAVLSQNHPCFFHLFGAASALGLCLVLINRRLGSQEITHIIQDTTPEVIIADPENKELALSLKESQPSLRHCYIVDQNLDRLYTAQDCQGQTQPLPNTPYMIIHTAAVQGKARGAVLSQENLILANLQLIQAYDLDRESCYLNILPLFHIMGVNLALAVLMAGGKNVVLEKFSPQKCVDLIQTEAVTLLGSFPPILTQLHDCIQECRTTLPSLKIHAGLEGLDMVEKWEASTTSRFWTMYGQTETSGLITFAPYTEEPGSAGKISCLANLAIGDDQDEIQPANTVGEILLKGPLVFQGYWNANELNAVTFRNGWHHTGDLGLIDEKGYLYFKGRKAEKELIKPGGENVFPAEVENAILTHEAVEKVCVFGVPDPKFGEGIKAVCTLVPGQTLTQKELITHTGNRIAGYKKPRYVEFIETMPLTPDGQIDRAKVKELYG